LGAEDSCGLGNGEEILFDGYILFDPRAHERLQARELLRGKRRPAGNATVIPTEWNGVIDDEPGLRKELKGCGSEKEA